MEFPPESASDKEVDLRADQSVTVRSSKSRRRGTKGILLPVPQELNQTGGGDDLFIFYYPERWERMAAKGPVAPSADAQTSILYLVSGPSVDDGLDEDAEVLPGLSGLVALQADPQAGRSGLVEGDLVHQLLPAVLQHQTSGLLAFLKSRK